MRDCAAISGSGIIIFFVINFKGKILSGYNTEYYTRVQV